MNIHIIGGNGTVGNGICHELSSFHTVLPFGSKNYDSKNNCFIDESIFDCEVFIHAAGVTDEIIHEDFNKALYKCTFFITYLINKLHNSNVNFFVYISSIHIYGNLNNIINISTLVSPSSTYAYLHFLTEKLLIEKLAILGIRLLILRVPTVYGLPADLNQINRPKIIQYSFPNSLLKKGSIDLVSSGEQYRIFVSSRKIGKLINIWLNDKLNIQNIITPVNGRSVKVKDFARICIDQFQNNGFKVAYLYINSNIKDKIEIMTRVDPFYDCFESYSLENYLNEYFNFLG